MATKAAKSGGAGAGAASASDGGHLAGTAPVLSSLYPHDVGYKLLAVAPSLAKDESLMRACDAPAHLMGSLDWHANVPLARFKEVHALYTATLRERGGADGGGGGSGSKGGAGAGAGAGRGGGGGSSSSPSLSPLQLAVRAARPDLVEHLLTLPGADLAALYPCGHTLFSEACATAAGEVDVEDEDEEDEGSGQGKGKDGSTATATTAAAGATIARLLVATGSIKAAAVGKGSRTALLSACLAGLPDVVASLLAQPECTAAVVQQQDDDSVAPFAAACARACDPAPNRRLTKAERLAAGQVARQLMGTGHIQAKAKAAGVPSGMHGPSSFRDEVPNLVWAIRAHLPDVMEPLLDQPYPDKELMYSNSPARVAWLWAFKPSDASEGFHRHFHYWPGSHEEYEEWEYGRAMRCLRVLTRHRSARWGVDFEKLISRHGDISELLGDWAHVGPDVFTRAPCREALHWAIEAELEELVEYILKRDKPTGASLSLSLIRKGPADRKEGVALATQEVLTAKDGSGRTPYAVCARFLRLKGVRDWDYSQPLAKIKMTLSSALRAVDPSFDSYEEDEKEEEEARKDPGRDEDDGEEGEEAGGGGGVALAGAGAGAAAGGGGAGAGAGGKAGGGARGRWFEDEDEEEEDEDA